MFENVNASLTNGSCDDHNANILTNSYLEIRKWVIDKQCRPGQTPPNVESDHGLQCLLRGSCVRLKQTMKMPVNSASKLGVQKQF